jgi:oligosaccharyltransferase complex subunit delta (ribophorin II)
VSSTQPNLLVGLTNLLGQTVKQQFTVEAESAKSQRANGPALFTAKKRFTSKSSDGSTFELRLIEQNQQPEADFYVVRVNAVAQDSRYFVVEPQIEVKVTTSVNLADVQIGVADRDQAAPKLQKVEGNNQLKLDGDQQSKLFVRFNVKDRVKGTNKEAHQTFVRFTHVKSGREIVFLAQTSSANQYAADVDFLSNSKNFRHQSGAYNIDLIVSDSLFETPVTQRLAEIKLLFTEEQTTSGLEDKSRLYSALPEIKHTFRLPESTPPVVVSTVFTALCLAPIALLLVLWLAIGFNLSKFSFSLGGLLFHVSLGAIFGLFYCYWTHLNMFQTLRYLLLLGGVALFSGNKLLRNLHNSKYILIA